MEAWQLRQRFADRLSKTIGAVLIGLLLFIALLQTTLLSVVPIPKSMEFQGDHEAFLACFVDRAKLAKTDGVTSFRRDIKKSENRIRLVQSRGFLGPAAARAMYVDLFPGGFRISDGYYENSTYNLRPIRKYDWIIAWMCATGQF